MPCRLCGATRDESRPCEHRTVLLGARDNQYLRVPYGEEHPLVVRAAPCAACATPVGGIHHAGCAIEECPLCRKPFKDCACEAKWFPPEDDAEEEPGLPAVAVRRAPRPTSSEPSPL